ncbi:MAG: bifunctional anthranilate synthase component II/anthranilate phosphoribosyltransferase [Anaerolineae bacterium]|nr:bifunctional anthranilate synthase component II/anthranilate phosphoribosyltransferase [Anaerolineae bacterium]MDW8070674.1 bifunctional anthranilate synthase component II/anthranilate phosphoribosyltransferase [Anaerolineae bacterium]
MVLIIDNYDSFTYNLAQYLGELGIPVQVVRNDAITLDEIAALAPSHIVISPGPGRPEQAGISLEVIRRFAPEVPILGVCLGHQAIGAAFGGQVVRAERLMHGKVSHIHHDGKGIFAGLPSPFRATRYHSLILSEPLPECLEVCARTDEGEIMAVRHRSYPLVGVQFHPESFLTEHGHHLLRNFLELSAAPRSPVSVSVPAPTAVAVMTMRDALAKLLAGESLSEAEAQAAMTQIMHGQATPAQIGAFLAALRVKGETVAEIAGCARAMRHSAIKVRPRRQDTLVDTCGTGGDGMGTFNISTAAAFVVAGAGQPVAKHGNRSISSRCGSADVMEALGVRLELTAEQVAACIDEIGIGFLFAPLFHPAMKHAIGPRRELGVRTIFNILGPLTNPAGAAVQVLGVYDASLTEPLAHVLAALGCRAAFVVHGAGGMDELTTCGPNRISALRDGHVATYTLDPAELGLARAAPDDLRGGDAQENAALIRDILSGKRQGAPRDVTLLNAAAALVAAGRAADFAEGLRLARDSVDSGAAQRVLAQLVEFTRRL